jgi:hypothetical protein
MNGLIEYQVKQKMATQSFDEDLVIETKEQAQIIIDLIDEAERRPPEKPMVPSIEERIQQGIRHLKEGKYDHLFL